MSDNNFTGAVDGNADDDGNWDLGHKPTALETAIVGSGMTVSAGTITALQLQVIAAGTIDSVTVVAGTIVVFGSGSTVNACTTSGSVTVGTNAGFLNTNHTGAIEASSGGIVQGNTVTGNVTTSGCLVQGNTVTGTLSIESPTDNVSNNVVSGLLTITGNTGTITIVDNTINGGLTIEWSALYGQGQNSNNLFDINTFAAHKPITVSDAGTIGDLVNSKIVSTVAQLGRSLFLLP